MPKFSLTTKTSKQVSIQRKQVFWLVEFNLSEKALDTIPQSELPWLDGSLLYGFYCDPLPDDELEIKGRRFRVAKRIFNPTKRNSQDQKVVGRVQVEHLP